MMQKHRCKIFLTGLMGSGKSYWARKLEQYYAVPAVDLDEWIERQAGMAVADIFATQGEEKFRALEAEMLRSPQLPDGFIMACGGGTPCFHDNMTYMLQAGIVVWIDTPIPIIAQRLQHERSKRPLLQGLETAVQLETYLHQLRSIRLAWYKKAAIVLNTAHLTEHVLQQALDGYLKKHHLC